MTFLQWLLQEIIIMIYDTLGGVPCAEPSFRILESNLGDTHAKSFDNSHCTPLHHHTAEEDQLIKTFCDLLK